MGRRCVTDQSAPIDSDRRAFRVPAVWLDPACGSSGAAPVGSPVAGPARRHRPAVADHRAADRRRRRPARPAHAVGHARPRGDDRRLRSREPLRPATAAGRRARAATRRDRAGVRLARRRRARDRVRARSARDRRCRRHPLVRRLRDGRRRAARPLRRAAGDRGQGRREPDPDHRGRRGRPPRGAPHRRRLVARPHPGGLPGQGAARSGPRRPPAPRPRRQLGPRGDRGAPWRADGGRRLLDRAATR